MRCIFLSGTEMSPSKKNSNHLPLCSFSVAFPILCEVQEAMNKQYGKQVLHAQPRAQTCGPVCFHMSGSVMSVLPHFLDWVSRCLIYSRCTVFHYQKCIKNKRNPPTDLMSSGGERERRYDRWKNRRTG